MMPFRVAVSSAPDPQVSSRVDILTLTHPYTTAARAAGVVTGTGTDITRAVATNVLELKDTPANQLDCE